MEDLGSRDTELAAGPAGNADDDVAVLLARIARYTAVPVHEEPTQTEEPDPVESVADNRHKPSHPARGVRRVLKRRPVIRAEPMLGLQRRYLHPRFRMLP